MSTSTTYFGLVKPELTDAADITAMNENWDAVDEHLAKGGLINATSTDGINYTATAPWVKELYNGLEITVIPNMSSVQPNINLNLNGLGSKYVRMTLPFSSGNSGALATVNGWFSAGAPMTLRYHEKMNTWKSDLQRPSAQNLYGTVPVEGGGTGLEEVTTNSFLVGNGTEAMVEKTPIQARELMGITYGTDAPSGGKSGDIYFQII